MNIFKKITRKASIFFVTLYAKYIYNQGVRAAEYRHRREHKTIYLAAQTFHPDHLVTYDKVQFKTQKRVIGWEARLLTMQTLRRGCYYYTADRYGKDAMKPRDVEVRRRAFIRERLMLAGLI